MKRAVYGCGMLFAAAVAFLALLSLGVGAQPASPTRIINYQPAVPAGPAQNGSCWTNSIAIDRRAAWRCMIGNSIEDPCFSIPNLTGELVCGANPASQKSGFRLRLTKPLPKSTSDNSKPHPWLIKLADGSICSRFTGTRPFVGGRIVSMGCSDSSACEAGGDCPQMSGLAAFRRGRVWRADKLFYRADKNGISLIKQQWIAVATIWQ